MTIVAWYLRRAIPWMALLGCCAGAGLMAGMLERWPTSALVLLPALLACCAAAAAFCFDEAALPLAEVTPRGATWSRMARLSTALVPLAVWTVVVGIRPGDLPLARTSWWLLGAGVIALSAGLAGMASQRSAPRPGASLSTAVALAVLSPVIVTAFLGWESIYPVGEFGTSTRALWFGVTGVAVLTCLAALRPGVRR